MNPKNTNGISLRKDGYQSTTEARKSKHKLLVNEMDSIFGL